MPHFGTAVDGFKPSVKLFLRKHCHLPKRAMNICKMPAATLLLLGASPLYSLCHACPILHQQKCHSWRVRLCAHHFVCTVCPHAQWPWRRDTMQPHSTDEFIDMDKVTQLQSSRAWIWTWVLKFWQCPLHFATLKKSKVSTAEPFQRIASLRPVTWRDSSWHKSQH